DGILNVVIGGTTFTLAQVQAFNGTQSVNTGEGVLTLTGYSGNSFGGTVSFSYALSATIDNDSKVPTGNDSVSLTAFDDSVHVTVNGIGGTSASDDVVVRAVDDVPLASNDGGGTVTEDTGVTLSGNVLDNDTANADSPKAFDSWTASGHDNTAALGGLNTYGTLTQNADGSWSYALDNSRQATQALTAANTLP